MVVLRTRPLVAAGLLGLLAGCPDTQPPSSGDEPAEEERPSPPALGGPLASAGPDQRALEGMLVRLDGRGSQAGDDGRPLRYVWSQLGGGRAAVAIEDPTAPVTHFVAPRLLFEGSRAFLDFLLTVDDGRTRSEDRVRVTVIDDPAALHPAPLASGGPDREVLPGDDVELGLPDAAAALDPVCSRDPLCARPAIAYEWTQVEGPRVELRNATDPVASFVAPEGDAVLSFRLDVLSDASPRPRGPPGSGLRSAPDHVRVFVRDVPDRRLLDEPPTAIVAAGPIAPASGYLPRAAEEPAQDVRLEGSGDDPNRDSVAVLGYRPVVGRAPLDDLDRALLTLTPTWAGDPTPGQASPLTVLGLAFETQSGHLRSAPVLLAADWLLDRPIADAGRDPRKPTCAEQLRVCPPLDGGDLVTLDGSRSCVPGADGRCDGGDPSGGAALNLCWVQTFGPEVELDPPGTVPGCASQAERPTFVAPRPTTGRALSLAFQLSVAALGDPRQAWSVPDTVTVVIGVPDNDPPLARVGCRVVGAPPDATCSLVGDPLDVAEDQVVILDASSSSDPEGQPLEFHWELVPEPGQPPIELVPAPASSCANPSASPEGCVELRPQGVVSDQLLRLRLEAVDEGDLHTICGELGPGGAPPPGCVDTAGAPLGELRVRVRNTINEAPVADAGVDPIVRPGARVTLDGGASSDPNGDPLAYEWEVVTGGVSLTGPRTRTPSFTVPPLAEDAEIVLKLRVSDGLATSEFDDLTVHVLTRGPYVSSRHGDDEAVGARSAPVASLRRGLAIAEEAGFSLVHVDRGDYHLERDGPPLSIDDLSVSGGWTYDGTLLWTPPGGGAEAHTRLHTGFGLAVSGTAVLEAVTVVVDDPDDVGAPQTEGVRLGGAARLVGVAVDATASAADAATAVRIADGAPSIEGGSFTGGGDDALGVSCPGAASFRLSARAPRAGEDEPVPFAIRGGGAGDRRTGLYLGPECDLVAEDGSIAGTLEEGALGELAVGLDSASTLAPELRRVSILGGSADEVIGARLAGGLLEASPVRGGTASVRATGVSVPAGAGPVELAGDPGTFVVGGSGVGSGDTFGLAAASPVTVRGLALLAGDSPAGGVSGPQGSVEAVGAALGADAVLEELGRVAGADGTAVARATGVRAEGGIVRLVASAVAAGSAGDDASGVEVRAPAAVEAEACLIEGGADLADRSSGVRVEPGGAFSAVAGTVIDAGAARLAAVGLAAGGGVVLENALVFAGPAEDMVALRAEASALVHSSLLEARDGGLLGAALSILPGGGPVELRNVIVDGGGAGSAHAHVRDDGGGLPSVLRRVLFPPEPSCGAAAALVLPASGAPACDAAAIVALVPGAEPLVAQPLYESDPPYRPAEASPAVDAGTAEQAPALDGDGRARGGDGNGDGVDGFDVGPYER